MLLGRPVWELEVRQKAPQEQEGPEKKRYQKAAKMALQAQDWAKERHHTACWKARKEGACWKAPEDEQAHWEAPEEEACWKALEEEAH